MGCPEVGPRHGDTQTIASLVAWANEADLGRTVTVPRHPKNVLIKVRQPGGDRTAAPRRDREQVDTKKRNRLITRVAATKERRNETTISSTRSWLRVISKALRENNVRYLVDPGG